MALEGWGIPGWEQLPNWMTFGAAVVAGGFAQRAAHWTKNQALTAKDALDDARTEAVSARADADHANRRQEESRLDALAPVIYARARPFHYPSWLLYCEPTPDQRYRSVTDLTNGWGYTPWEGPKLVGADQQGVAQIVVTVDLHNVSQQVARIEIPTDQSGFVYTEGDQRVDWPIVILPNEHAKIIWRNFFPTGIFANDAELAKPENTTFAFRFHALDLGLN